MPRMIFIRLDFHDLNQKNVLYSFIVFSLHFCVKMSFHNVVVVVQSYFVWSVLSGRVKSWLTQVIFPDLGKGNLLVHEMSEAEKHSPACSMSSAQASASGSCTPSFPLCLQWRSPSSASPRAVVSSIIAALQLFTCSLLSQLNYRLFEFSLKTGTVFTIVSLAEQLAHGRRVMNVCWMNEWKLL